MEDDKLISFFARDRFAAYIGAKLVKVEPGYAVAEMEVTENHLNGVNIIQGGALFTLADFAFAAASNAYGQVVVGVNANISYFKVAKGNLLIAEAKKVSDSKKLANYNVDILDENKELVARLSVTGYKKEKHLEWE